MIHDSLWVVVVWKVPLPPRPVGFCHNRLSLIDMRRHTHHHTNTFTLDWQSQRAVAFALFYFGNIYVSRPMWHVVFPKAPSLGLLYSTQTCFQCAVLFKTLPPCSFVTVDTFLRREINKTKVCMNQNLLVKTKLYLVPMQTKFSSLFCLSITNTQQQLLSFYHVVKEEADVSYPGWTSSDTFFLSPVIHLYHIQKAATGKDKGNEKYHTN